MSDGLRLALIDHDGDEQVVELAAALQERGHRPTIVAARSRLASVGDRLLARRGFSAPIAHVPWVVRELRRGSYDVVHAFSAPDAFAALRANRPVVFTCSEVIDRSTVASGRQRLRMLREAIERSDRLLAPDQTVAQSLQRWFAVEAEVVAWPDVESMLAVYSLLARP